MRDACIILKAILFVLFSTLIISCDDYSCFRSTMVMVNQTKEEFFSTNKIIPTPISDVKYESIITSEEFTIFSNKYGTEIIAMYILPDNNSAKNNVTAFTSVRPEYDYKLAIDTNINDGIWGSYEEQAKFCSHLVYLGGSPQMNFDSTKKFKIDKDNLNNWYLYYDNSWWLWDVTALKIIWEKPDVTRP